MKTDDLINIKLENKINYSIDKYLNLNISINTYYIDYIKEYYKNKNNKLLLDILSNYMNIIKKNNYFIHNNIGLLNDNHIHITINTNFEKNNSNNNLLITNSLYAPELLSYNYKFDLFTTYNDLFNNNENIIKHKLNKINIDNIYGMYDNYNEKIYNSIELNNKYDNIQINIIKPAYFIYYSIYHYITSYYYIYVIFLALKSLKKGGNLLIKLSLFKNNKVLGKLIQLLYDKFNNFTYKFDKEFFYTNHIYIDVKNFKGLNKKEYELFLKLGNNSLKYKNTLNNIINYKYYYDTKLNNNEPGNLYFKFKKISNIKVKKIDKLLIITDIDELNEPSLFIQKLIMNIKNYYDIYINEYLFNIQRYINNKDNNIKNDDFKEYKDKLYNTYIENTIKKLEEQNIPYNKSYLKIINKYNNHKIDKIYSLNNNHQQTLINYLSTNNNNNKLYIKPKLKPYQMTDLNYIQDKLHNLLITKNILLDKLGINKEPINIKSLDEGLTRGVSRYISSNYKLNHSISNGFIKLWEIYNSDKYILPLDESMNINVFHMAEAPGQWIHATDYYIYSKLVKYDDNRPIKYNWYANSMNPYNPKNISKYGKNIFKDDYGFISKYPNRWIYGHDDTGDITNSKNIKWYSKFLNEQYNDKSLGKLKLITGDAGLVSDVPLYINQKIDLAQCIMVLACCNIGTNCIIKHFIPYIASVPESDEASGLYFNIIYLYYSFFRKVKLIKPNTSNPLSGEFYVIGYNFKGINEDILDKLYIHLDTMKNNECFIHKELLPDKFIKQVMKFFIDLNMMNIEQKEIRLDLLNCSIELKNIRNNKTYSKQYVKAMNCNKYLDTKWSKSIINEKIKTWIDDNDFN